MAGQVLRFDDSVHREIDAVLPWYVNRTLDGDESARVEMHLRDCARCRREVEMQQQLRAACAVADEVRDLMPSYRRVRERIENGGVLSRLVPIVQRLARSWRVAPAWTKWAMAIQLGAICAFGSMLATNGAFEPAYRTLGAPDARARPAHAVAVVFAPGTGEAELRRIVLAAGARIADGPTASNAYVLELPAAGPQQALATLRAEPAVVLAEPLSASSPP